MKLKKLFALFLAMTMTVSSVPQVYAGELLIEEAPVEESVQADDLLVEETPVFEDELTEAPAVDLAAEEFVDEAPAEAIPADDVYDDGEIEIYDGGEFEEPPVVGVEIEPIYVTYIYGDGTEDYKQEIIPVDGEKTYVDPLPEIPTRTGYDFVKWSKQNSADGADFFEANDGKGEELTGDIALYAIWDAHDVTVTYSFGTPEGGYEVDEDVYELPDDKVVDFGTAGSTLVEGIEDPVCEGNVFDGWYVGDKKVADYTVDTEPSIEVTAHWKLDTGYSIEYVKGIDDSDNKITLPALPENNGKLNYGDEIALEDPNPTELNGSVFMGWAYDDDPEHILTDTFAFDADTTQDGTVKKVTLTGVWELYEGFVNFYDENDELIEAKEFTYGGSVTEPTHPEKEGHTWAGWKLGDGTSFNAQKVEFTEDVDVWASYDINTFTVTFKEAEKDKDGKLVDKVVEEVEYDTTVEVPAAPEKEGMKFVNWVYTKDGKEVVFDATTKVQSDLTVTAKYEANAYSITFENTRDSKFADDKAVAAINAKFGETVGTASSSKYVIKDLKDVDNYHFLGWYYTVKENGKDVEKKLADAPTTVPVDGLVLTAKWQLYYKVTFFNEQNGFASDADIKEGKTIEVNVPADKDGKEAEIGTAITLKKADIEGYTEPQTTEDYYFWNWEKDGAEFIFIEDATKKIPATEITGNAEIKAKWSQFFTITLDPNGGEIEGSKTAIEKRVPAGKAYNEFFELEYDEGQYRRPEATLEGNELVGWVVNGTTEIINIYDFDKPVEGATRLTAFWVPEGSDPIAEDTKGNNYVTLAEADIKAAEGDTLKLIADKVTTGENGVTFTKNFTLDLNGKTLTGNIAVASGKKLTIKDSANGTLSKSELSGNIVIAGGTYLNVTLAADAAVVIDPAGTAKFDEGTKDQMEAANNEGTVFDPDKYILAITQSSSGYYVLTEYKTLTYNLGDYPGAPSPKEVKVAKGDKTVEPAPGEDGKWAPVEIPDRAYDENGDALSDGFVPAGWYTDTNFKTAFTFGKTLDKDTTIYLKWEGFHNVTFKFDDASIENGKVVKKETEEEPVVVKHDTALTEDQIPDDPTKTIDGVEKEFEFWGTVDEDGNWTEFDLTSKITESITLIAKWKAAVTFDPANGEDPTVTPVAYGGKVTKPADPKKENAVFEGWYYADENGNASDEVFEFNTRIYDDVELVAVWNLTEDWQFTKVYSEVATLGGDGTLTTDAIDYVGTEAKPIVITGVEKWSPYEGSKDVLTGYYLGYQLEAPSSITSANINKYSISYDGKNWVALESVVDENTNTNGNYVVNVFEPIQLTNLKTWADAKKPVEIRTYKIALTSDKEDAQELKVTFDPNYVEVKNADGETELTIIDYTYNIHTVTFDAQMDGITVEDQAVADKHTAKDPEEADEELKLEADGYVFQYWTDVAPAKWKAENPDDAAAQGPKEFDFAGTAITKDITLYGYWHKVHTVTLIERDKEPQEVVFRDGVHRTTIEAQIGTPAGAHGWIDDNDVEFKGNSTYDANWTLTDDLTLYAQYEESKIVFNFLNNDLASESFEKELPVAIGNYLTDKIDAKTGDVIISKTEKLAVKTYAPKNMVFGYWTLDEPDKDEDNNLTNVYTNAPKEFVPSENLVQKDMILYAYWKNETVKVTFKYADGTETVIDANKGEALPEDEYPETKEYGAYWTSVAPAEDGTWADRPAKWGMKRTFNSDSTLYEYAPEEPVDVIFNFNDNGKTADKKVVVNKGDVVPSNDIPKLESVGAYWTKVAPKDGEWEEAPEKFDFTKIIEEATTLYAYAPNVFIELSEEMIAVDPSKTAEVTAEMFELDEIAKAEIEDADLATVEFTNDGEGKGTIKVTAGDHYGLSTVTVTTKGGATAELKVRVHFDDMTNPASPLHYDAVYWAADNGITTGWDDNTFRPMNNVNRAAAVTFLWRVAGMPEPTKMATFSDMTGNEEFDKAISWAQENGITTGWDDNTFRPWDTCKRAAIITFIWRYAGKPQATKSATFDDMPDNADFVAAINWGVSEDIVHGWEEDNTFRPWDTCKRHAMLQFLYAFAN